MAQTDLERILGLPRRTAPPSDLASMMTDHCARPGVTPPFQLYDEQALALLEAADCKGLVMSAPVGSGKTLPIFLIPTVREATKPLVVVPASLREKTEEEWCQYAEHWNLVQPIIKSYTEISRDKDAQGISRILGRYNPDVVLCDEAHYIGNLEAGVTKKIMRYLQEEPGAAFCAFTGTLLNRSLMDGWHLCAYALREGSPLPLQKSTCIAWSAATDPGKSEEARHKAANRVKLFSIPGCMDNVRAGIREWIKGTPGFVTSGAKYTGPLSISREECQPPPECEEAIEMAANGLRPDGEPIDAFARLGVADEYPGMADESTRTVLSRWRLVQTLFLGYWDKPDPEPPSDWLLARAKWGLFVGEALKEHPELDTPDAVKMAVEQGSLSAGMRSDGRHKLRKWQQAKADYRYSTKPVWLAKKADALVFAADWLREHPRGLVWTPSEHSGRQVSKLAAEIGVAAPFFGAGQGKVRAGVRSPVIERHRGPAVLTVEANKTGRNLQGHLGQYAWCDNLMLTTPATSGVHDQVIGRTHRAGQIHHVTVTYIRGLPAHDAAYQAALSNAEFVRDITGDMPKLLGEHNGI